MDHNGEISDSPVKNNKFDNVMDACMYAIEGETRHMGEEWDSPIWGRTETIAMGPERLEVGS
ncbi:MAG: hypothetical protein ACREP9_10320 [Candidatus Dormibacteraceae bacterium]